MNKLEVLRDWIGDLNWEGTAGDALSDVIDKIDELNEKVVVPQFVADWYEGIKHDTLHSKLKDLLSCNNTDLSKWANNLEGRYNNPLANAQETIAMMDLFGYEVEKEKLYYVLDKDERTMLFRRVDGELERSIGQKIEYRQAIKMDYALTEKEIKNYDMRFWVFAKEVIE